MPRKLVTCIVMVLLPLGVFVGVGSGEISDDVSEYSVGDTTPVYDSGFDQTVAQDKLDGLTEERDNNLDESTVVDPMPEQQEPIDLISPTVKAVDNASDTLPSSPYPPTIFDPVNVYMAADATVERFVYAGASGVEPTRGQIIDSKRTSRPERIRRSFCQSLEPEK